MSQEQVQRQEEGEQQQKQLSDPIKYGDVFRNISGELASKAVMPQDAAMMQTAESMVFGRTQKGGPAAAMQAAATHNERAGLVAHTDMSDVAGDQGVTVREVAAPGARIVTELVGGQAVGEYVEPTPVQHGNEAVDEQMGITIGEALEAAGHAVGDKAVERSDAAAIQAAEVRATGSSVVVPGGLAAKAQSAVSFNEKMDRDEDKIKLSTLLTEATGKMAADKVATKQDAEGVRSAELRNNPMAVTQPGGVAASVSSAARLNQNITQQ